MEELDDVETYKGMVRGRYESQLMWDAARYDRDAALSRAEYFRMSLCLAGNTHTWPTFLTFSVTGPSKFLWLDIDLSLFMLRAIRHKIFGQGLDETEFDKAIVELPVYCKAACPDGVTEIIIEEAKKLANVQLKTCTRLVITHVLPPAEKKIVFRVCETDNA